MKGGVTEQDMVLRKRKAAAFDEAWRYIEGRASTTEGVTIRSILRRALVDRETAAADPA